MATFGTKKKFLKITRNGMRWAINRSYFDVVMDGLIDDLDIHINMPGCRTVKSNLFRTVYRLPLNGNRAGFYIKRYNTRGWRAVIKYAVLPSRAFTEWEMMRILSEVGVKSAVPVACGEKRKGPVLIDSCLITEEIHGGMPLGKFIKKSSRLNKDILLQELAELAYSLHKNRIFHRDFHCDNIVVSPDIKGFPSLYIVDLHTVKRLPLLSLNKKIKVLAKLHDSLQKLLRQEDMRKLLTLYSLKDVSFGSKFEKNSKKVENFSSKIRSRHLKSRTKRCKKVSSSFTVEIKGNHKIYRRREVEDDLLLAAIRLHRDNLIKNKSVLKITKRSALTIVMPEHSSRALCVKEYFDAGPADRLKCLLGYSRGKNAWVCGNGLLVRGVLTAKPLAFVKEFSSFFQERGYLIAESLAHLKRVDHYIIQEFSRGLENLKRKRSFILQFAGSIGDLHRKKIYHGDLKAPNIFVHEQSPGLWNYYFVDYDRVNFEAKISMRRVSKNLAQIHTSIPECITGTDRVRFLKKYLDTTGSSSFKRYIINGVLRESKKRIAVTTRPIE